MFCEFQLEDMYAIEIFCFEICVTKNRADETVVDKKTAEKYYTQISGECKIQSRKHFEICSGNISYKGYYIWIPFFFNHYTNFKIKG